MRPEGWAFMLISVSAVTALVSFCYYKVLTTTKTNGRAGGDESQNRDAGTNREPQSEDMTRN